MNGLRIARAMNNASSVRFHWLDWIRFLSALLVVLVHARGEVFSQYGELDSSSRNLLVAFWFAITRLGNEAVIVFFVMSGFLVGGMAIERMLNGTFSAASYAIDRSVRIFLPLVPLLILSGLLKTALGEPQSIWSLAGNLLFLQWVLVEPFAGNAPLWSIAYEGWFYLLIFAVGGLVIGQLKRWLVIAIAIAFAIVFSTLDSVYLFCWLIGAGGYLGSVI